MFFRQCWKCDRSFIKETGCNKMTCTCGGIMCYICRNPVKDYSHFGNGSDKRYRPSIKLQIQLKVAHEIPGVHCGRTIWALYTSIMYSKEQDAPKKNWDWLRTPKSSNQIPQKIWQGFDSFIFSKTKYFKCIGLWLNALFLSYGFYFVNWFMLSMLSYELRFNTLY